MHSIKWALISLLLVGSAVSQTATTFSVRQQGTTDLSTSIDAAQAKCTAEWSTCYIVIESVFHKIDGETLPTPCAKCVWVDNRISIPVGTGAGMLAAGNDARFNAGGGTWGSITGTLSAQTDLNTALNGKAASNASTTVNGTTCTLGSTCTPAAASLSGAYIDWNAVSGGAFIQNKPTIPAAQVQSDWNAGSGMGQILNKPTLGALAAKSAVDYSTSDITNKPTLGALAAKASVDYATGDVTNKPTLGTVASHAVGEFAVVNASTTVNGQVCALGSTCSITAITGQQAFKTSDTSGSASNTLVTTGMTFSIAANTQYTLDCNIIFTVSTTSGVGLTMGVTGPGTPTQVSLMRQINTSATAFRVDSSQGASWGAKVGATATTVTALSLAHFYGTIENGSTAGTLDVQFANIGTTGTTVIKRGSWCKLQ